MASPRLQMQERVLQDFGKRLRYLRQARQLRQLDMADFGLSYKYYQRLEAGQVNPTLLTLHRLASVFQVSVAEFFCSEPEASTLSMRTQAISH